MTPRATYRLQLSPDFTLFAAAELVPYLAELGISHVYVSPVLQAAEGSTHGYDVVDPERVSEELGGEEGWTALVTAVRGAGLAILLDIVPNHMSIAGARNRWWYDVLENGPASYYAAVFDVDWGGQGEAPRVLLPILGERYGRALTSGVLGVERDGDAYRVRAHDRLLPLSPRSLGGIVARAADRIPDSPHHAELGYVGEALAALPASHERERAARAKRHRHRAVLLDRLTALRGDSAVSDAIDAQLAEVSSDPTQLDAVLERQNYRLAHWSVAGDALTYRRFFDIATLVGLRMEDPDVFALTHARILGWLTDGSIAGVRVDHIDGLRDPAGYLAQLRAAAPEGAWIVVEKILAQDEQLPPSFAVDGTTGYEFADDVTRLLVDPASERALTDTFTGYTGEPWDPAVQRRRARHDVMSDALHAELSRLTELAVTACAQSPACRDYTRTEIETALAELLAGYPVYRTYLGAGDDREADRDVVHHAHAAAREANPALDEDLLGFLAAALACELPAHAARELAIVAQQTTGPIVAKGDEDTLSYRAVRLLARCEVGADIGVLATDPAAIHSAFAMRGPRCLLGSSTHDTKRGEDVRARACVLSEIPERWHAAVMRWGERAARGWGDAERDRVLEYTLFQTFVAAWPLSVSRAQRFAEKATREARLRTSWRKPDEAYERARVAWIDGVFADRELIADIAAFADEIASHGDRNALAALALKLCAPGVPDFYNGSEVVAATLVDPDNRSPVDFAQLREEIARTASAIGNDLASRKLRVVHRVLAARRRAPDRFAGPYRPLTASGPHAHRVFAFARGDSLTCIVPRLGVAADGWRDTTIAVPAGSWRDIVTDRSFVVRGDAQLVQDFWTDLPVAILEKD